MKSSPIAVLAAATLVASLSFPPSAHAAEVTGEPGAASRYEHADADGDGRISREEFFSSVRNKKRWWQLGRRTANTGQNSATPGMFEAMDINKDGFLTAAELEAGRMLRESRGQNSAGASATKSNRPATSPERVQQGDTSGEKGTEGRAKDIRK